jgi:hypothetical protein
MQAIVDYQLVPFTNILDFVDIETIFFSVSAKTRVKITTGDADTRII